MLHTLFFRPSSSSASCSSAFYYILLTITEHDDRTWHSRYSPIQVAINDILVMVLYVPTLYLLLDLTNVEIPYRTIVLSVVLFVALPFSLGSIVRLTLFRGQAGVIRMDTFEKALQPLVKVGLLATVLLTFVFQGETIRVSWTHIVLIAVGLPIVHVWAHVHVWTPYCSTYEPPMDPPMDPLWTPYGPPRSR
jgi:hypothetical protein